MGNVSTKVCAKLRCAPLRIKKALGIYFKNKKKKNNNNNYRVGLAFGGPPSVSKKYMQKFQTHTCAKTEFNVIWPFKVIQGYIFWGLWKGDEELNKAI